MADDDSNDVGILHPQVLLLSAGVSGSVILGYRFYGRYVKRVRTYLDLTPGTLASQRSLYGKVTRVGDGDNFRFYHTPGGVMLGWGWLRSVPTTRSELKDETLMIRLCGVDAPERAHWGKPAQPFSEEALNWLQSYVMDKNVRITPYLIDQYKRIVARAQVWKWNGKRDVSAEMIRNGIGVVYEAKTGAEFGQNEDWYRSLEKSAKKSQRGVWGLHSLVTPGEYKKANYK